MNAEQSLTYCQRVCQCMSAVSGGKYTASLAYGDWKNWITVKQDGTAIMFLHHDDVTEFIRELLDKKLMKGLNDDA